MTAREQIIAAAREAGFKPGYLGHIYTGTSTEAVERFYAIAFEAGRKSVNTEFALAEAYRCGEEASRQAEREACAVVCDCYTLDDDRKNDDARRCAAAIRARGDSK